jgi:hypothetical protein
MNRESYMHGARVERLTTTTYIRTYVRRDQPTTKAVDESDRVTDMIVL